MKGSQTSFRAGKFFVFFEQELPMVFDVEGKALCVVVQRAAVRRRNELLLRDF